MSTNVIPAELEVIFKNLPKLSTVDEQVILRAYERAAKAHEGQLRQSGEPYMIHCLAVAQILSELRLDAEAISAALLHDVIEDTNITLEDLETEFGIAIARLVDGVTKMDKLPTDVEGMKSGKAGNREAETLRKLFLAMGNDMRVVLIKLADRLHNMRTLGYLPPDRQRRMARETMDIFAPLANRLGIWQMKWELEDLSFRYLNPVQYKEIAGQLAERRVDREKYMVRLKEKLLGELTAAGISAQISARPKHIYSIFRKMDRKRVMFSEVYDVRAVRVIVASKPLCYQALGVVHSLWRPIPSEFDDYIAAPKENFYQSLHTAVLDDEGKTLEIQIRTQEMHEHAEYGVAAHWRYKEGAKRDEEFEKRLVYLRRLMDFDEDDEAIKQNADEFVSAMKTQVFENRVYVFTPKGDIIDLPAGATPIDFAYHIHTEIGNRCRGAKVNGQRVGLDYRLQSGERVEILTSKRGGPSLDWLNPNMGFVHTTRGSNKIKGWFRKQDRDKNIAQGSDVTDREMKRLGLSSMPRETVASLFNYPKAEDFLWHVGLGDITAAQIATKVLEAEREKNIALGRELADRELKRIGRFGIVSRETVAALFDCIKSDDFLAQVGAGTITGTQIATKVMELEGKAQNYTALSNRDSVRAQNVAESIDILGTKGMLINLGRCCNPVQGEPIVGYITRGKGVTVHRADCLNVINSTEPERFINVSWGRPTEQTYAVPVEILAYDREGLMRDIGAVVANENINISNVNISTRNGVATFLVTMQIENVTQLSRVLARIEQLSNVVEAHRRTSA